MDKWKILLILFLIHSGNVFSYPSYYDTLGVNPSSSQEEIKKAYRRLSMKYHPDRNPSKNANEVMAQINLAYETLKDPNKRSTYDRYYREFQRDQSDFDFNSDFDSAFKDDYDSKTRYKTQSEWNTEYQSDFDFNFTFNFGFDRSVHNPQKQKYYYDDDWDERWNRKGIWVLIAVILFFKAMDGRAMETVQTEFMEKPAIVEYEDQEIPLKKRDCSFVFTK